MPIAYPKRIILWQSGKTCFFSPAPIRLLTKEPVTPANALTITENSAETLLTMFDTANYNRQNEKYEFSKRKVQEETFEYSLNEVRTSLFHSVILYPFERSHIEFKQDIFTTFN